MYNRNADTLFEAFKSPGAVQYQYLSNILPMMSIILHEYGKYQIESLRQRVGMVMYGCTFWYLVGLASEVAIANTKATKPNLQQNLESSVNKNLESIAVQSNNNSNDIYDSSEENQLENEIEIEQDLINELNSNDQRDNIITPGESNPWDIDAIAETLPDYINKNKTFHLCHHGGSPFRDFTLFMPVLTFITGWGPGLYDEGREEASLCFQHWMKVRKKLMTRTPMEQVVQLHNKRQYLIKTCKSMSREK